LDEVERQDSLIQREITAADMERMLSYFIDVAKFQTYTSYLKSENRIMLACKVGPHETRRT
jgi:hypothetical protein